MITLQQHLRVSAAAIETEARQYAKSHGVTIEEARQDVSDAFAQSWHDYRSEHPELELADVAEELT